MHKHCAVPVYTDYFPLRPLLGNSQCNHGRMAHPTHCHEQIVMFPISPMALLIQLPRYLTRGGHHNRITGQSPQYMPKHFFPLHPVTVFPCKRLFFLKSPLLHDYRKLVAMFQRLTGLMQNLVHFFVCRILINHTVRNLQRL